MKKLQVQGLGYLLCKRKGKKDEGKLKSMVTETTFDISWRYHQPSTGLEQARVVRWMREKPQEALTHGQRGNPHRSPEPAPAININRAHTGCLQWHYRSAR